MKRAFKQVVKLKTGKILCARELHYDLQEDAYNSTRFKLSIIDLETEFREESIETETREIFEDKPDPFCENCVDIEKGITIPTLGGTTICIDCGRDTDGKR